MSEATLTPLERLQKGAGLAVAVQDANGDVVYSNNRAHMGYLAANKHMVVGTSFVNFPKAHGKLDVSVQSFGSMQGPDNYLGEKGQEFAARFPYIVLQDDKGEETQLQYLKLAAMNYVKLVTAQVDSPNAYVAAGLRARWMLLGAYEELDADPNTKYSECVIVGGSGVTTPGIYDDIDRASNIEDVLTAMGDFAKGFAAEHVSTEHGSEFVTANADAFWTLSEHLFRTKGHHYKKSLAEEPVYKSFVDRYLTAAYEGNFSWPAAIDRFVIFHTAIHPFKIRALVTMTAKLMSHGTVSNAALIRLSGSPVGTAVITTTCAALDTMRGEAWYAPFHKVYNQDIREVEEYSAHIHQNRYGFHISARLYGVQPVRVINSTSMEGTIGIEQAKSRVSAIAAAAQGMITALKDAKRANVIDDFNLSNARALEKAASANPLLAVRINVLVTKAVDTVTEAKTLNSAIENALPRLLSADKGEE
jgi:hypothetical protein